MRDDASLGVRSRDRGRTTACSRSAISEAAALHRSADAGGRCGRYWDARRAAARALIVERVTGSSRTIRCGYDLFSEVEFLLSAGQPPERAGTPTLDLHIALMRQWIVAAGIPLWEIPPVPPGHQFLACLTHDVDFLGIRRHRLDRTLAGFLLRASRRQPARAHPWPSLAADSYSGTGPRCCRSRSSTPACCRTSGSRSIVTSRRTASSARHSSWSRSGIGPAEGSMARAIRGGASSMRPWRQGRGWQELRSLDFEVGVHGIDAWSDLAAATDELREVARLTGQAELGVRMHWLYFDASSFATLDHAGFVYDASIGYNDAVGFRAGTTQVFRPLSAERLLELPLHIQDSALFFPGRMNCTEPEALDLCQRILDWTQRTRRRDAPCHGTSAASCRSASGTARTGGCSRSSGSEAHMSGLRGTWCRGSALAAL